MKRMSLFLIAVVALFVGSCGDDGTMVYYPVTKTISAENGGTITSADEQASLEIPAGALEEDTKLSVENVGQATLEGYTLASDIYEFGPEGLTFKKDVVLSIKANREIPVGSEIHIVVIRDEEASYGGSNDGDEAGSGNALQGDPIMLVNPIIQGDPIMLGESILAKIGHFSRFALVIVDN